MFNTDFCYDNKIWSRMLVHYLHFSFISYLIEATSFLGYVLVRMIFGCLKAICVHSVYVMYVLSPPLTPQAVKNSTAISDNVLAVAQMCCVRRKFSVHQS